MTTIGRSVVITGDVTSNEDLQIDGAVHGQILLRDATLVVGADARIEADIRAARVRVLGRVSGNITAGDRIELSEFADVTGNLSANHVVIVDGAEFNGRVDMDRRTIAAKVAQYKAAQAT